MVPNTKNKTLTSLLLYFVLPAAAGYLLFLFGDPLTYSSATLSEELALLSDLVLAGVFVLTMVLGIAAVYKYVKLFLKNGDLPVLNAALGFLILAVFSVASGVSFINEDPNTIGWLVQAGTLIAALWFLGISVVKSRVIDEQQRPIVVFLRSLSAFVFSAVTTWLIFLTSDILPLVFSFEAGWGTELLWVRFLTAIVFLVAGLILLVRRQHYALAGALLLLAVGSGAVSVVYFKNIIAFHPLIWFNRMLTVGALWVFLGGPTYRRLVDKITTDNKDNKGIDSSRE